MSFSRFLTHLSQARIYRNGMRCYPIKGDPNAKNISEGMFYLGQKYFKNRWVFYFYSYLAGLAEVADYISEMKMPTLTYTNNNSTISSIFLAIVVFGLLCQVHLICFHADKEAIFRQAYMIDLNMLQQLKAFDYEFQREMIRFENAKEIVKICSRLQENFELLDDDAKKLCEDTLQSLNSMLSDFKPEIRFDKKLIIKFLISATLAVLMVSNL
ncbi:MAG: hypothetical protein MHPSP_001489 [Paramarteilia canceri]